MQSEPESAAVPAPAFPAPSRARRLLRSPGLRMILLVVAAGGALAWGFDAIGGPEVLRARFGAELAVAVVPVQAVVAVSPFPSELVAIAAGPVFGFWPAIGFNWMAWMLAAFLQYALAQRVARDFDFDAARRRLPRWIRDLPAHHPCFLIFGRWIPWGPHLVNTAAGAYEVPLARHAWCAAISIVPQAVFIAGVANGLFGGF